MNMQEEITLQMLGDRVTLMRSAWLKLLDEMREDSPLAAQIRHRIWASSRSVEPVELGVLGGAVRPDADDGEDPQQPPACEWPQASLRPGRRQEPEAPAVR
jgi:hypothetical protein